MAPVLTPKEGDRVLVDQNEETVATPGFPQENPHNFGPASSRDSTVYTCERPGGDPSNPDSKIPTQAVVDAWVQFMTSSENQIRHVVILLRDAELEAYEDPGLIAAYEAAGIVVHHIPFASDDSYKRIMTVIDEIESKGERVVAHCTHGMGRSGRVAAGVSFVVVVYFYVKSPLREESFLVLPCQLSHVTAGLALLTYAHDIWRVVARSQVWSFCRTGC